MFKSLVRGLLMYDINHWSKTQPSGIVKNSLLGIWNAVEAWNSNFFNRFYNKSQGKTIIFQRNNSLIILPGTGFDA